ncbi:MAG: aminotransferase class III-fold pyridoxal phosphate-dependent enzyme [Pirellulales bacterium]
MTLPCYGSTCCFSPSKRGPCPDTFRYPDGVDAGSACEVYLAEYRKLFRQFGDRLAAVIIEPLVQGAAGMVMHPAGFLKGLAVMAAEYDVLLIADEIAVGMGRTGRMWACQWEDVQPDILCTGKGLSGGTLPIAATITTRRIWNAFLGSYDQSRSFFHGHTYGGNPVCAAAALATLDLFESDRTLEHVSAMSSELTELLQPLTEHPHVGDVRIRGLAAAVELVRDKRSLEPYAWSERRGHRVCSTALRHGVWLRPLGNVVVIMPPLCIGSNELKLLVEAVRCGIDEATLR